MSSSAEQMRAWQGPALFTYGFRPFFLGAAVWAVIAMALWSGALAGLLDMPTSLDPASWHAHAFLFGYLSAVIAGFLLTAVPNWTGRLPIVGWPLAALFGLWVAGRIAVLFSTGMSPLFVAAVDLAMPIALAAVIAREIVVGKNWRNLMILGMLIAFAVGNAVFHWEAAHGGYAAQGLGLRIGLGASLMMIAVVGGRVVPSFTRNWLVKQGAQKLPVPPMQSFDKVSLLILLIALLLWAALPMSLVTGVVLAVAGGLHMARLKRWAGLATVSEPLIFVLHVAYFFVPFGAMAVAAQIAMPARSGFGAVQHLWMAGAVGLMTLAVMTRAILGHTGQHLTAGWGTCGIYLGLLGAILLRVLAGTMPWYGTVLYGVSAVLWIASFAGFAVIYGPLLLRAQPAKAV